MESEIDLEFVIVTELLFHIWKLGTAIAWLSLHRAENAGECFALYWLGSLRALHALLPIRGVMEMG